MSRAGVESDRGRLAQLIGLFGLLLLAGCVASAQTGNDQTQGIISALKQNNYAEALQLTEAGLRQSPASPQLWTLRAMAFSGKGDRGEALEAFRHALQSSPNYLPALEGAGQLLYQDRSQKAVPFLEQIVRMRPTDQVAHAMLGSLAFLRGDCTAAVQHFEDSREQLQSQRSAMLEYASCLAQLHETEKAISVVQSLLSANPNDTEVRRAVAILQLKAEKPGDAVQTLAPLLEAGNVDVPTARLAGEAYEANQDTPRAVQTLHDAIVRDPTNVDLYVDFANIAFAHQSFQAGVEMLNVGLRTVPKSATLYLARGILYVQLAHYDEAEADFEKAQQIDPQQSFSAAAQGLLASKASGATKESLSELRRKLAKTPNDAFLWSLEASLLTEGSPDPGTPEYSEAMRAAKKAVSLNPSLASAYDAQAKLYQAAGNINEAIQQSRNALHYDPRDQTALYRLIMLLRKTDKKDEIPELLKRLAELRQEATRKEAEENRYKLTIEPSTSSVANQSSERN